MELEMPAVHRLPLARIAVLFIALGLVACGSESEPAREPPPVQDTVFGDMVGTKDKARAVEDSMQQQKEERDRAIDAAQSEQ
jgi:hypothetical protein